MEKKPQSKFGKINHMRTFQPSNSALRKLLLKQNLEILRSYSQKEFSEVFLGNFRFFPLEKNSDFFLVKNMDFSIKSGKL